MLTLIIFGVEPFLKILFFFSFFNQHFLSVCRLLGETDGRRELVRRTGLVS
jgi:hypothetical protein